MQEDPETLEAALGHTFGNRELLARALTHKSRAFEKPGAETEGDNEQLEFLGDSVLGFLVSEALLTRHPDFPEGALSKLKSRLVSATHLYEVAQRLRLGQYLRLGRGEEMSGGRTKRALLSDALEALIAALFQDGGIDCARKFVVDQIIAGFDPLGTDVELPVTDFKSALQEKAQSMKLPQPRYVIVNEHGPEHSKTFTVEVRIGRDWSSQADGGSKKEAGQKAAELVLKMLTSKSAE